MRSHLSYVVLFIYNRTHGKISFANLAKQIGGAWNSLSPPQKKKYADGAAKEKARYQEELRIYKMKKRKEMEDKDGDEESLENDSQLDEFDEDSKDRYPSRKRRKKYQQNRLQKQSSITQTPRIQDTPSGLTIEIAKPRQTRLRSRRYRPMYTLPTAKTNYDSLYPLPLNFDASRCHPSEIVDDKFMMEAVSPLLNNPHPRPFNQQDASHHPNQETSRDNFNFQNELDFEAKVSIPSIQSTTSNVSSASGNNSNATGPDNEMADILTYFLKDGDFDKHNPNNNEVSLKGVNCKSELYSL